MSEKTYVTKEQARGLQFPSDMRQCFEHESSQPKTMPEYTLVKAFIRMTEYEKLVSLEVLKFLFQFTFATRDQIVRMLEMKGIDPAGLDDLIARMLDEKKMNSFYFDRFSQTGPAPDDAFVLYCMDFGALAILTHFSNSDCISWFTTDSCKSSQLVQKYLSTVEFYLALAETRGDSLRYFKPTFDVAFGHRAIRFSGAFEIMQGFSSHTFLLESIRSFDLPSEWMDKVDDKIVHFAVQEKNWTKYFQAPGPVYLFLVQEEKDLLETSHIFWARTNLENFRLTTDAEVGKGLANARFWKYTPSPTGDGAVGELTAVRSAILAGVDKKP